MISLGAMLFSTNVFAEIFTIESTFNDTISFLNESEVSNTNSSTPSDGFLKKPSMSYNPDIKTEGISGILEYTVGPGDSLSVIASRFNLDTATIAYSNNLSSYTIKPGQKLKIPPVDGIIYKVEKGNTLESIAKKYNVDKVKVISQNNLKEGEKLAMGSNIVLPGAKPPIIKKAPSNPRVASTSIYQSPSVNTTLSSTITAFTGKFAWPVAGGGAISQGYKRNHRAIDITYKGNNLHPNILAAESGKVIEAKTGWNGGYGNVIVIDHGGGFKTRYAHNRTMFVKTGQYVQKGQVISDMGNTGRVYGKTGIHTHFELIKNGKKVNPLLYY